MTEKESHTTLIIVFFLTLPFTFLWRGYVLTILWGWFLVPLGVMALTIPMALGISTMISFLIHGTISHKLTWEAYTSFWTYPLVMLLIGWVYTLFM